MSGKGLLGINLAAARVAPDGHAATPRYAGQITESVARLDMEHPIAERDPSTLSGRQIVADKQLDWDGIFQENDPAITREELKLTHDDFLRLIAGTRNRFSLSEWSQLDPLDRSFYDGLRHSAASNLARAAKAHLKMDHPLLPDIVDAACHLFENGTAHNSRIDRMLAAKIVVSAAPYLQVGSRPAHSAAVILREFIEAQIQRNEDLKEQRPYRTAFNSATRMKPRPLMITEKLIAIMKRKALELAQMRVTAATDEVLACMEAYGSLIPTFKAGHTEVMAGMLMCSAVVDDSSNTDLMTKAFELRGELSDIQNSGPGVPRIPLTYV